MAAVKKRSQINSGAVHRVSPLKPGLRGARNWAAARVRAAGHTRRAMIRFIGSIVLMFSFLVFMALWLGGFMPQVRQSLHDFKVDRLMGMGFVVRQVDVMGEGRLNEADVRAAAGINAGEYFFGADLERAQNRAESLPWVDRAVVRRLWPNRIVIQIVETRPYALWQHDGQFSLICADGNEITNLSTMESIPEGLKTYIGVDAPKHAAIIQATLEGHSEIWNRTQSLVRMPKGRWDLHLTGGLVIKLPAQNLTAALGRLGDLQSGLQILDRKIGVIDMRLPDRITFAPVPENEQA